jgi:hypothetical protein
MGHGRGIYIWNGVRKLERIVEVGGLDKTIPGLGNRVAAVPKWEFVVGESLAGRRPSRKYGIVV